MIHSTKILFNFCWALVCVQWWEYVPCLHRRAVIFHHGNSDIQQLSVSDVKSPLVRKDFSFVYLGTDPFPAKYAYFAKDLHTV